MPSAAVCESQLNWFIYKNNWTGNRWGISINSITNDRLKNFDRRGKKIEIFPRYSQLRSLKRTLIEFEWKNYSPATAAITKSKTFSKKKKEKKRKEKENRKNCFEKSAVEEGFGGGWNAVWQSHNGGLLSVDQLVPKLWLTGSSILEQRLGIIIKFIQSNTMVSIKSIKFRNYRLDGERQWRGKVRCGGGVWGGWNAVRPSQKHRTRGNSVINAQHNAK